LKVVRDGKPGFFKQWASRHAKFGVWHSNADAAQVLVKAYGGMATMQALAASGLERVYIDDLTAVVGAKRAMNIAGLIDLKAGRVKRQPLRKFGLIAGRFGLVIGALAILWNSLSATIPWETILQVVSIGFILALAAVLLTGFATIKLKFDGDRGWLSRWRACKISMVVAGCCLPLALLNGQLENLRDAESEAILTSQKAAEEAEYAATPPRIRFQRCLDLSHSQNECRSVYGSREDYVDWMRSRGYDEDTVQYMANLPVEASSPAADTMNSCASGDSCEDFLRMIR
jgi:hypothetical protein